jgi:hypothetical protein
MEGGGLLSLGVALERAWINSSELSVVSNRGFLLADVLADLLQFRADRGDGVAQKCSPAKFRSLPHSRAMAIALFPLRNPITDATGCLGELRCTCAHGPASDVPQQSGIPSAFSLVIIKPP